MAHDGLKESWRRLKTLFAGDWAGDEAQRALSALGAASHGAPPDEVAAVCAEMGAFIRSADVQEAGLVALAGGALVEHGAPIAPLAPALLARLPGVLAAAERFVTAVRAAFPEPTDETEEDPPDDAVWVDPVHVPRPWVEDFAARDRDAVAAYVGLDNWCHPLIAMATRDRPLLVRLAGDAAFQSALAPASEASGGAGWLANLLQVPMHETLEFVDVRSGRAFELLADGVASNFELHTLLAAALAPPLGHAPPGRLVLDCLAGRGPQSSNAPSEGFWNLYIWHAAAVPPGALRSAPHDLWIWNEGKPADIPRFENRRVVLAGEAAYPRSWSTSRSYGALYPRIDLVRELPPDEARERIARLRAEATTLRPELAKPPEPAREDVRPDPPSRAEEKGGTLGRLLKRIGLGRG